MSGTGTGLELQVGGAIAHLRLRRAHAANSFDASFWQQLPLCLAQIAGDPSVRVVIMSGEGKHFSAGMDLAYFASAQRRADWEEGRYREWLRRLILSLQRPITQLEELGVPVVAAVQGACLGAGLDLACACDLRYATADAFFAVQETAIGMTADLGVLQRLPRIVGAQAAREMAYTGAKISAAEAHAIGLIGAPLSNVDELMSKVEGVAQQIAGRSPLAMTGTKAAFTAQAREALAQELAHIASWNAAMWVSEDLAIGIEAQRARTDPVYRDLLGPAPLKE